MSIQTYKMSNDMKWALAVVLIIVVSSVCIYYAVENQTDNWREWLETHNCAQIKYKIDHVAPKYYQNYYVENCL